MALTAGTRIGPFLVKSSLGEGGMGVVFRALDTKLQRDVALKLLPDHFADDPERLARFQREAQVLASLNHPNIAQIYGLEESENTRCIVMELVEGETLQERLKRGPIPLDEALPIARQTAEALEAAHEKGIIHRDLKPANVKITPDGKVKILDFGLAKAFQDEHATTLSNSPTLMSASVPGVILGTAAYMSPEQARGQSAGHQADIWAFGVVLYEMLTGKQAFTGETITDVLGGIVRVDPDWTALPKSTPSLIHLLLRQCLQKNRSGRLHHIGDARIAIDAALNDPSLATSAAPPRIDVRRRAVGWIAAVVLLLASAAAALFVDRYAQPEPTNMGAIQLSIPPPNKTTFAGGPNAPYFSVSPDGRHLAFIANLEGVSRIWVRSLDTAEPHPLTGTERVAPYPPFWSADSRFIAFFAEGKLKKIDVAGGPAQTLCDAAATDNPSGTWNRDGVIVFGGGARPLKRVSAAAGGTPEAITTLDQSRQEQGHDWPTFLPDGEHFFFLARSSIPENNAIFIGSLGSKQTKLVINARSRIAYDPAGYLLFVREQSLLALPFDARKLAPAGDPFVVADQVRSNPGGQTSLTVSGNGVLAYRRGNVERNTLTWFDRSGRPLGTLGPIGGYEYPELSADGKRVAIGRFDAQTQAPDVWVIDVARAVPTRLTFGALAIGVLWAPNGQQVSFESLAGGGTPGVFVKQSSGAGSEEPLFKIPGVIQDWSPDGEFIISVARSAILVVPLPGDRKPFPYLPETTFARGHAQFSPDGRWVAYRSNESGRNEVYIQSFPTPSMKWQISTGGGDSPRWRRDGKEIFYLSQDQKLTAVSLMPTAKGMEISSPTPLFEIAVAPSQRPQYDVTADGQRFLVNSITDESETPVTVIVNWTAALKKK